MWDPIKGQDVDNRLLLSVYIWFTVALGEREFSFVCCEKGQAWINNKEFQWVELGSRP